MPPSPAVPAHEQVASGFRLGPLKIDPTTGEAAGPAGVEKLDPKVMGVLVLLAQNAGQVVLRTDLLDRLWPGVVVTDEALSRCIYELRRQLSQAAGDEQFKDAIETLPKRGYRLKAAVTPDVPAPVSPPERKRNLAPILFGAAAVLVAALVAWWLVRPENNSSPVRHATHSIAVLPFVDMSQTGDQAYLADGITEEILNRLAQSEDLRVIARTSSFALRDSGLDVAEIARRLQVTHVLEGSIRKSGDTVRITAQLIAASDSSHVWSDTFDRRIPDLLAVQDEVAIAVATALEITLSGDHATPRRPANAEAYEKFLQAEFFYHRRAPGDIERAISYYELAVELDPQFARGWASLSGAYSFVGFTESGQGPPSLIEKQQQAALRAVELDPDLAIAHVRLAQFYEESGDRPKSKEHMARARALDPDEPLVLTDASTRAVDRGDIKTAIEIQRGIVERDPLAGIMRQLLAVLLLADGQYEAALSEFRKVQDIHPESDAGISREIAPVLVLLRRFDEAEAEANKLPEGKVRDQAMAPIHVATGRDREADATLARMAASQDEIFDTIRLAETYAYRGDANQALHLLEGRKQSLSRERGADSAHVWYLQHEARMSPFLKVLHGDDRWAAFIAELDSDAKPY